jgi:hypothetical protein
LNNVGVLLGPIYIYSNLGSKMFDFLISGKRLKRFSRKPEDAEEPEKDTGGNHHTRIRGRWISGR